MAVIFFHERSAVTIFAPWKCIAIRVGCAFEKFSDYLRKVDCGNRSGGKKDETASPPGSLRRNARTAEASSRYSGAGVTVPFHALLPDGDRGSVPHSSSFHR
jgi:hypothetical protein